MAPSNILYFGDQTVETVSFLHDLLRKSETSPILQKFLAETVNALRLDISILSEDEKNLLPIFRTPFDLVAKHGDLDSNVVLSTVLLCIAQIGDYIVRVEHNPSLLGSSGYPVPQRRILGLCTGLLPAAVAAFSTNLVELNDTAREVVLLSLRLGLSAHHRSSLIEATAGSWSVAISSKYLAEIQSTIDQFHHSQSIPIHKQVYISCETRSSITVSGPPYILDKYISSYGFSDPRSSRLPILAAFHAPHLAAPTAESIIHSSPLFLASIPAGTTLINPTSGSPYAENILRDLLRKSVEHIFQEELFTGKAVESALKGLRGSEVTVSIFGPSNADGFLRQSLKISGLEDATIQIPDKVQANDTTEAIAIVGMAGRFPGSDTLQGFWDILVQNKDLHQKVPRDRWDISTHFDPTGKTPNAALSAFGCFIEKPGVFDNVMFNMSPREALQTDPIQRLLLMTTYEALEMAGYCYDVRPNRSRISTYMGLAADDWREYNISQEIDMYFATGGLRSFASGRLNYFFKFDGPSYAIDTACSSSGAAIELACASLLSQNCDMAVAGGANVMTGPNLWAGLSCAGFVSLTGGCKTFDETADGYCRGDGIGVVVLKRLTDAVAQGDPIHGIIRGIAINHSANAASITQPYSPSQISLYKEVLRKSNLSPHQVSYIESHGTGTQLGDIAEVKSVVATFGSDSGRNQDNPLYLGGVKANIGHGEGAAGVTSLIKSLMMFRENAIPPHAGLKTRINPKLPPLESENIHIARKVTPFLASGEPRRVLISNFGATGGNTCMVVEEPPKRDLCGEDPRSHHVVVVSAKEQSSLQGNKQRLLDFLLANPELRLEDIAYTTTARRTHHPLRSSFCVSSAMELRHALTSQMLSTPEHAGGSSKVQAPIIFIFPGQGFNFCGLARYLYYTCKPFQQTLVELDQLCRSLDLPSFIDLVLDDKQPDVIGQSPVQAHLAIASLEISLVRLLKSWGLFPNAVIGHSLGEYAALCTAGVLQVADTLLLVGKRAQLVEELCTKGTHGMLAVQASADQFKSIIEGWDSGAFDISCYNSPNSIVVNGSIKVLKRLQIALEENYLIKSSYVSVPFAFHSAQLDTMLEKYRKVASCVTFSKPSIPVASTLLGKIVNDECVFSASYLVDQTRNPVQFEATIKAMQADSLITNNTLFVETGPGDMCLSMARVALAKSCKLLPCLQSADSNWKTLSKVMAEAYIGGTSINWSEYHKHYKSNLAVVDLPTYHFNLKDFWIQYKGGVAAMANEMTSLKEQLAIRAAEPHPHPPEIKKPQIIDIPPISTCLHRVTMEETSIDGGVVEFSTNLQETNLRKLIDGHNVIGIALAPSSVYQEMALGAAQYLYKLLKPDKVVLAMDLHKLVISSPLFLGKNSSDPQLVNIRANIEPGSSIAKIIVSSIKEHCRCEINLEPGDWAREWSRRCYLIQDRALRLMGPTPENPVHHLLKDIVYKIFNPIAKYSAEYQSISEIYIDPSFREAAVRLDLREMPAESAFTFDPCSLESIAQTAGFLLNANPSNPEDIIFMSTGCEILRLSSTLSGSKQYFCHLRVESVDDSNGFLCDVAVFDKSSAVALGEGLTFKRVKKAVLRKMLGLPTTEIPNHTAAKGSKIAQQMQETTIKTQAKISTSKAFDASISRRGVETEVTAIPPVSLGGNHLRTYPTANGVGTMLESLRGTNVPIKSSTKAVEPKSITNDNFFAVLELIGKEIGTSLNDVEDGMTLEDLGIDSLLAISITTRLKSEKNLELPASLIAGTTNISKLREHFTQNSDLGVEIIEDHLDTLGSTTNTLVPSSPYISAKMTTPLTSLDFNNNEQDDQQPPEESRLMIAFIDALASETGLSPGEIGDDTPFIDLGIDSLMAIAVIGVVKDRTGIELPANLFTECNSAIEVRKVLDKDKGANGQSLLSRSEPAAQAPPMKTFRQEEYHSRVVLLQGNPNSKHPSIFLVTDGGGSAAVYVHLPILSPNLKVYAIESPFIRGKEDDFLLPEVTIDGVAAIFVRAIRSVQPHGPYIIGGYSIGGVFAYETMRRLINTGDRVHGFIIFDSACPRSLKGTIDINTEVCEMMGLYDKISADDQRKPLTHAQKVHVAGCTRTAANFDPVPIKKEDQPAHTFIIWARTGFIAHLADKIIEVGSAIAKKNGIEKDLNPEWVEWLESEKKSFGPRGWDKLVGRNIETFVLDGDHFSIIMRPHIQFGLGPLAQKLVKRILSDFGTTKMPSTIKLSRRLVEDAFGHSKALVEQFAEEAGCSDFLSNVYPAQRWLVLAFITEAFAKIRQPLDNVHPGSAPNPSGILPKHRMLLNALYEILEDGRLLELRNGKLVRTYRPVDQTPSQKLYEQLLLDHPLYANMHQLLHVTGSRLAECLTGDIDPMKLIFGKSRALLQEFYTTAPMFVAASKHVTELLRHVFSDSTDVIEILEVGAGLGGTTKYILDMLIQAGTPFRFVYTDISPSLAAAAKQRYAHLPEGCMEYMALDIERTPPEKLRDRFHAILSTNCIHATKNLTTSCSNARKMLRPGGFLALVETTPRLFWLDLVFGLLEGWWLFEDGRKHCLASEDFWKASLEAAGYSSVLWTEGEGSTKPNPQLIIACIE